MPEALYVGLMSGTSIDAIDSALLRCGDSGIELLATHEHGIPGDLRERIAAISQPGRNEIDRLGALDRELGQLFARATLDLLESAGEKPGSITAIGSHGQTVRHRPPSAGPAKGTAFSLQIGDPNTIAETTGITTVADFRRRDIASGGEGAPLAPAFHAAAFSRPGVNRAIVNVGGIANVSLLAGSELRGGFDTGPGNTLMDNWIGRQRGERLDRDGQWAAEGSVAKALLARMLAHPFFSRVGPRSTGKEDFNLAWLDNCLSDLAPLDPRDVQATLAELTATAIARALEVSEMTVDEVYVCGGGAHNTDLMRRLYQQLQPATLDTTGALGMDPDWVEAATFAWLAWRTIEGLAGNAPAVTGAAGSRILGGIYPG
mgnify:CR=1 FL=1